MIRKIKVITASLIAVPFLLLTSSGTLAYNPLDKACQGSAINSPTCQDALNQQSNPVAGPNGIINKAANIIALVAVIGGVIMIIIGGFEFITAGGSPIGQRAGDPNKAKQARTRIVSAVIGIALVSLAWAIVRLITDRVLQ